MAGRLRKADTPVQTASEEARPLWKIMMRLVQAMGSDIPAVSIDELRTHCSRMLPGLEQGWQTTERDAWLMPTPRNRNSAPLPAQQKSLKPLDVVSRYSMYREGLWARASVLLVDAGKLHCLADVIVHPETLHQLGISPGDAINVRTYSGEQSYHIGVRDDVSPGVLFVARRGVAGALSSDSEAELVGGNH